MRDFILTVRYLDASSTTEIVSEKELADRLAAFLQEDSTAVTFVINLKPQVPLRERAEQARKGWSK